MLNRLLCVALCLLAANASVAFGQSIITAGSVNGVLNPTQYSGSDIGAKVNTAWASGLGKTVRIPAGTYQFTTTMNHPGAGYTLQCDAGAVLNYTGAGDAVHIPGTSGASTQASGIEGEGGCLINGTSAGKSGIHLDVSNHTYVRNIRITGFSNGYGILDTGANTVSITGNNIRNNNIGIYMTGICNAVGCYPANAVNIRDNEIVNNASWGIDSENSHCACGPNVANQISDNTVEDNGSGIELNWDQGTSVDGNYLENAGVNLGLGNGLDNILSINVLRNHFTDGSGMPEGISLGYGIGFHFEDNEEIGQSSLHCFINKTYGPNGSDAGIRGIGTNYLLSGGNEVCNHGTPGN